VATSCPPADDVVAARCASRYPTIERTKWIGAREHATRRTGRGRKPLNAGTIKSPRPRAQGEPALLSSRNQLPVPHGEAELRFV
jgi:hypothetical protein